MLRKMNKFLAVTLAFAMVATGTLAFLPTASSAAKKAKLSTTKTTLYKGKSKKVTIKNVTKKQVKSLKCTTSKKSVATVKKSGSNAGNITAKKKGKATITFKFKVKKKKYSLKVNVTVKEKTVTPTATPVVVPSTAPTEVPAATENPVIAEAVNDSLMSTGNNVRLKKVIDKAKSGQKVNIACIGGSITKGSGGGDNCYVNVFTNLMKQAYGSDNINVVNAGVAGTPSTVGWLRYYHDVVFQLGAKPDLVVVEFAVNDSSDSDVTGGECYESMVKGILQEENAPAVVLMFSLFRQNWYTRQDLYQKVGEKYNLGMISMQNAVKQRIIDGKLAETDFFNPAEESPNQLHPGVAGHSIMGRSLFNYVQKAYEKATDAADITIPDAANAAIIASGASIGARFANFATMFPGQPRPTGITSFDKGGFRIDTKVETNKHGETWIHTKNDTKPMVIKANCKGFLFTYREQTLADEGGKVDVYLDGVKAKTIDPFKELADGGWDHYCTDLLFIDDTAKDHTIEFKMADEDVSKSFYLSFIGVCN